MKKNRCAPFSRKVEEEEGLRIVKNKCVPFFRIDDSVNRNQLTGDARFVDEIERRIGLRVERRGRGRPKNCEK